MLKTICAALALLVGCPAQAGAEPSEPNATEARRIHWQRSVADAQELARRTGRPLLLALNMDGESASDRIWHENYRDPRFVALTRRCVCVGASVFRHNATDYDEHGNRVPCPRFCGLTCGEHVALEPELFRVWFRDENRVAPRHVLVRPDGSKAFDLSLMFDLQDIDRAIESEVDGVEPWCAEPPSDWIGLAKRRDAVGRAALERALADVDDPATRDEALAALAAHGDAGALPALRLLAARLPDAPIGRLLAVARGLGVGDAFAAALRAQGQRPSTPLDLAPPPDLGAIARGLAAGPPDPATSAWLCALAAVHEVDDGVVWPAVFTAFGRSVADELHFGRVAIGSILAVGDEVAAAAGDLPAPRPALVSRALRDAEALRERLTELDRMLAGDEDAAATLAEAGIASLDLGRVDAERGGATAALLFEDAARLLGRALDAEPRRGEWLLEAARTSYYRGRFDEQHSFAVRAFEASGFYWPPAPGVWPDVLRSAEAVEALRWIGDADARLCAAIDPTVGEGGARSTARLIGTMRSALFALTLAAASPSGRGRDFATAASFAGSRGLVREQLALLTTGLRRLPGDGDLHGAAIGAAWAAGRYRWSASMAGPLDAAGSSAEAAWWAGYDHVVVAEQLRREERPEAADAVYRRAERLFAACARRNPAYAASADGYRALCLLGRGHAAAQGAAADRERAAELLVRAAAVPVDVRALRDGLGYDAVDLVDKVLEWRVGGPSPVFAVPLLGELEGAAANTPVGLAFWASAVSDGALREALRADGRNPERRMADTVDAAGEPIRMEMGLPTELGDRYLAEAVAAGRAAAEAEGAGDEERRLYAQALTIRAERELVRGRADGVARSLARAAEALGVALPAPPDGADRLAALSAQAAPLRELLGPARPRQREGR